MSELTVGKVTDDGFVPKTKTRPTRKEDIYSGEPPRTADGRIAQRYQLTNEKCNLKEEINGKTVKCEQLLLVQRTKNAKFEKDESGFGGQLNYDEKDVKQYKYCPTHGPFPPGKETW